MFASYSGHVTVSMYHELQVLPPLTCSANRHVRGECGARRPLAPSRSFDARPFPEIWPFQTACAHLQPILAVEHIAIYHIGRRTEHTAGDRLFGIDVIDFSHLW